MELGNNHLLGYFLPVCNDTIYNSKEAPYLLFCYAEDLPIRALWWLNLQRTVKVCDARMTNYLILAGYQNIFSKRSPPRFYLSLSTGRDFQIWASIIFTRACLGCAPTSLFTTLPPLINKIAGMDVMPYLMLVSGL